ncbi:hypothetical protein BGZ97_013176 [Linnemannia gamsii]|uniref:F-box domain-containing protein n=1 Tax=Linnemannia gamsii TaxID=64522 RepID=A0A9P6UL06_9FUNG|nr:hypothetical protein BGZ97_013176 [Linnemannia gamsii]
MAKQTNPLELPEILTRVAHFLPLWVEAPNKYNGQLKTEFKPRTLLNCMRVSKLWYQVMLPVFWYTYTGSHCARAPLEIIHRFSPHFRVFQSFQGHEGPYQCTGLVELIMSQYSKTYYSNGVDIETQRSLVALNRDLRKLYWHGPAKLVHMDADSLTGLRRIYDLMILYWQGSNGLLTKVLQAVSGTVTRLGLYSIHGVAEGDLMVDSGNGIKEQLILPHVVKLAYRINHKESKGLEDLVRCCPNLKKLYIIPEKTYDMVRLKRNMQECCYKLEALTVKFVELDENDLVALLRGCRAGPGLVRLRLSVQRLSDAVTDAILAYSATLQSVKIDIHVPNILDVKNVLRILVECRRAWRVDVRGCGVGDYDSSDGVDDDDDDDDIRRSRETKEKEKKARDEDTRLEAKASRLFEMGWKVGRQRSYYYDGIAKEQSVEEVVDVLGLAEDLKRLKTICWNDVCYVRLS